MNLLKRWFDKSDFSHKNNGEEGRECDHLQPIRDYLNEGSDYFYEHFIDKDKGGPFIFWVDWREEDGDIIEYCESILKTGELTAVYNKTDDEMGFEIIITYKGKQHKIPYKDNQADRDITIITLNEILKPDYEIRFCIDSDENDTLAFLPLSTQELQQLESEFGQEKLDSYFSPINTNSTLFN